MISPIGIGASSTSLTAHPSRTRSFDMFGKTNEQSSTGIKMNRGADNSAGLIAIDKLQVELTVLENVSCNSSRASQVIGEIRTTFGAFQAMLESNRATLSDTQISLAKSVNLIEDTDFAIAVSEQTKIGILTEAGINSLLIANNSRSGMLRFFD